MTDVTPTTAEEPANPVGRPLKYKTPGALKKAISDYFKGCDAHWVYGNDWVLARDSKGALKKDENGQNFYEWLKTRTKTAQLPYTVSGLARSLGISRDTLIAYRGRSEFVDSIQAAYDRCHEFTESQLYANNAGAQFSLKNNWGWNDKTEVDHTTKGNEINPFGGLTVEELRKLAQQDD